MARRAKPQDDDRQDHDQQQDVTVARTFSERLACKLTETEKAERGKELAAACGELETAEARRKQVTATLAAEAKEQAGRVFRLSQTINQGWEHRDVEVQELHVWTENKVQQVRTDTGQLIHERPMTEFERQRPLPLTT